MAVSVDSFLLDVLCGDHHKSLKKLSKIKRKKIIFLIANLI